MGNQLIGKNFHHNFSIVSETFQLQGGEHCRETEFSLLVNCKKSTYEVVWQRSLLIYDV